jgi:hypothetical protein
MTENTDREVVLGEGQGIETSGMDAEEGDEGG